MRVAFRAENTRSFKESKASFRSKPFASRASFKNFPSPPADPVTKKSGANSQVFRKTVISALVIIFVSHEPIDCCCDTVG